MNHAQEIVEQGFTVIPDVIPVDECDRISESLLATVAEHGYDAPDQIGFVPSVINFDQSFVSYLASDELLGLAESLLGDDVRVSFTSATINFPGNERNLWHSDWPFNQRNSSRIKAPYSDRLMHLTTLWMLSAFTKENGGTLLVPGSHRRSSNPTVNGRVIEPFDDEIQATGEQGSVLVMDSRMWHATAANETPAPRVSLAVRYAPWWLNLGVLKPGQQQDTIQVAEGTSHNYVPGITPEAFERLPDNIKPLYAHWVDL